MEKESDRIQDSSIFAVTERIELAAAVKIILGDRSAKGMKIKMVIYTNLFFQFFMVLYSFLFKLRYVLTWSPLPKLLEIYSVVQ